jgi:hypothetical protein
MTAKKRRVRDMSKRKQFCPDCGKELNEAEWLVGQCNACDPFEDEDLMEEYFGEPEYVEVPPRHHANETQAPYEDTLISEFYSEEELKKAGIRPNPIPRKLWIKTMHENNLKENINKLWDEYRDMIDDSYEQFAEDMTKQFEIAKESYKDVGEEHYRACSVCGMLMRYESCAYMEGFHFDTCI